MMAPQSIRKAPQQCVFPPPPVLHEDSGGGGRHGKEQCLHMGALVKRWGLCTDLESKTSPGLRAFPPQPSSLTCEAYDLGRRPRNGALQRSQQRSMWGGCHQAGGELGLGWAA